MNLLFVDDEADILEIVEAALDFEEGIDATFTSSGQEAINLVNDHYYDIIVLDMMMPEPDGIEVLAAIKPKAVREGSMVVMCTANPTPEAETRLKALGADEVLHKPFNPLSLIGRLREIQDAQAAG
jgi:two-component system, OmpR family, response regulator